MMAKFALYLASSSSTIVTLQLVIMIMIMSCCCCHATTTYTVGDSSGWDISTDLDSWARNKTFYVGDVLLFQYSSSNSVEEVEKENFDNCSTTNAIQTFSSNGNTSVPLTRQGGWYFTSGNRLYCLGGMKLQLMISTNTNTNTNHDAPLPAPTSKTDNPAAFTPSSTTHADYYLYSTLLLLSLATLVCIGTD